MIHGPNYHQIRGTVFRSDCLYKKFPDRNRCCSPITAACRVFAFSTKRPDTIKTKLASLSKKMLQSASFSEGPVFCGPSSDMKNETFLWLTTLLSRALGLNLYTLIIFHIVFGWKSARLPLMQSETHLVQCCLITLFSHYDVRSPSRAGSIPSRVFEYHYLWRHTTKRYLKCPNTYFLWCDHETNIVSYEYLYKIFRICWQ